MTKLVILCENDVMKTVRVAELKAHLSAHLRMASSGEEVLVLDRNTPIARIVPLAEPVARTREERLIASGVLRAPVDSEERSRSMPVPVKSAKPITAGRWQALWDEERADRV